jgi:cation transporter-like permease
MSVEIEVKQDMFTEILVGTFVVGTIAYLVSNSWGKSFDTLIDHFDPDSKVSRTRIVLTFTYAITVTIIAVVLLIALSKFNFIGEASKSL